MYIENRYPSTINRSRYSMDEVPPESIVPLFIYLFY